MSCEIVGTIYIKGWEKFDQWKKLNLTQIKIDTNELVANFACNQKLKYCFVVNNLLFSFVVTNDTAVVFIACNELNETKRALINVKLHKTIRVIDITETENENLLKS